MSGMTRLDTINTDGVPICRMAGLTAVEIVHRERRVGRYFVQTLSRGNCSLHGVLVVMDTIGWKQDKQSFTQNSKKVLLTVHTELLVVIFKHSSTFSNHFFFDNYKVLCLLTSSNGLHAGRQTQTPEAIVEDLIVLQCCRRVVGNLHARSKAIEYPIPPQHWMRLS